jgi:hypothetical protein
MSDPSARKVQRVSDRWRFGGEWLQNGRRAFGDGDVFGAFFYSYIALVCAATQVIADNGSQGQVERADDEKWEGAAIRQALVLQSVELSRWIESPEGRRVTSSLRLREVPGGSESKIVGTDDDKYFAKIVGYLDSFWNPNRTQPLSKQEMNLHAECCAYLLRRIRNRLFHGQKTYDRQGADADLLDKIDPLLSGIVEVLLNQ